MISMNTESVILQLPEYIAPTSGESPQSTSVAEIPDFSIFSQKARRPIYTMFSGAFHLGVATVRISFLGLPDLFLLQSLRPGPLSLGFMAISALDFSSSLPSLLWLRTHVCAQCPALESHKYQDACSSFSPASVLES